jgi:ribosome biogenesis GTPase
LRRPPTPPASSAVPALVLTTHSRILTLWHEGRELQANLAGRLREGQVPVAGDRVDVEPAGKEWRITALRPRDTAFARYDADARRPQVLAANATLGVIMIAPQPLLDFMWAERLMIGAALGGIPPLLVINKSDLLDSEDLGDRPEYLDKIGLPWILASAKRGDRLDELKEKLRGHTAFLAGHSGVGKSTLLNRLLPEAGAKIGELNRLGYGSHATSAAHLHRGADFQLLDLAGVREFPLQGLLVPADLPDYFPELAGRRELCRFRDCRHLQEPGCAVNAALPEIDPRRQALYRQLQNELTAS